ncbi:MAG: hypothetical protein K1W41_22490 [Lachnospiraceae bacterium]
MMIHINFDAPENQDSEINDSIGNAQIIGTENAFTGGSVTGIIDTIKDMDYYKLNINSHL